VKKATRIVAILGIGMTLVPWITAQTPVAEKLPTAPAQAITIPSDQQPTKEQLAKLFEVMRLREQLQDYFTKMDVAAQKQAMVQASEVVTKICGDCKMTPEQNTAINNAMSRYAARLINAYTVDERIDNICAIYQRHLSRSDVDALLGFYGSPAGQHLLDQKPPIMQEFVTEYMMRMQERAGPAANELANEMQKMISSPVAAKDKHVKK
jgi:hypothetical protein